jgi:LTXXQ motif family protein
LYLEEPMPKQILIGALLAVLVAPGTVLAVDSLDITPVVHQELNRALDELSGHVHGLGDRWRDHFARAESPAGRPVITLMLNWRQELGLTASQVESLERLRSEFEREATRRDADIRAAENELTALLQAQTVSIGPVEAKVREIEKQRADFRLARIKTIEQGRSQLTPEQRAKLSSLLAGSTPKRLGA